MNADWDETAADLYAIDAATDDATVVSDADEGIVRAFTDENLTIGLTSSTSGEH